MNNTVEMNRLSGTIEYGYRRTEGITEAEVHMEKFYSLNEMLNLTSNIKMEDIKQQLNAVHIEVDAICFNSQTADSKTKVEFLMLKEHEFFGQVIQTA